MSTQWSDTDEVDGLPERWSWVDIPAWFVGLWPALKEGLHRWLHRSLPDCPDCAGWRDEAARRANEVLRLNRVLARQAQEREVMSSTVRPENIAVAYDMKTVPDLGLEPSGNATSPNLERIIANITEPPVVAEEPRKPEGQAVIPVALGGDSITVKRAAEKGTGHPAHSRPNASWPQRRSCIRAQAEAGE